MGFSTQAIRPYSGGYSLLHIIYTHETHRCKANSARPRPAPMNASSSMGIIQAHSLVTGEPEIHRLPGDPNYYTPSNGKLIYHPSNDALKNPTLMSDGNSYYRSKTSGKQVVHPNSLTGSTVDFNGQRWLVANSKPTSSNRASPLGRADSYGDDRAKQQPAPRAEFRNFRGETYKYTTSGELVRVSGQRYTGL
ncbi:hypothetical protein K474DRAFT_1664501 [Panus rudis PR-1116 ss-1]|nr:hypothetical protein K474DRAFT_1664501 [Panus rudis PR-1116 ss-1]